MVWAVRDRAVRAAIGFAVFVAFLFALTIRPTTSTHREATASLVASHGIAQLVGPARELRESPPVKVGHGHALVPVLPVAFVVAHHVAVATACFIGIVPDGQDDRPAPPNPRTTPNASRAPPQLG